MAPVRVLIATTTLLLVGHGGLAMEGKPTLIQHAGMLGMGPAALATLVACP